ncbi:hypothetical protein M5K25_004304 [Dendrobium thyrsiflorum]|uniref:Methyltransferase n=1 Tax=Dendrobium thyrsiflorum TaxID=117978 RepID=A0ABD0VTV3_DENTH
MAKSGALDLAIGVGGKIKKEEVESAVETYEKYHVQFGGDEETRKTNYSDMVNKYYDLATSFYEFGWGESFHFASRWKGESLKESIKRHEHFLALQLGLKSGMKELNRLAGLGNSCNFVKADFMKMPFPDNTFDAIYAIEATCHAPNSDLAADSPVPWYLPLDTSHFSLSSFRLTAFGRFITRTMVQMLEFVRLAPAGSMRVSSFLEKAAEGLVDGGRMEIFTPMYFFLARKPLSES